ncbi:zinc finger protein [Saccharopolyspora elongata]|uniref:zinc finger protein n=1 Tax=Saccharopolyspora elongata TaxID=2530387 RepID=UPI0014045263|nr:zinc finger protein [Saccharopolyspora elongata]
MFELFQRRGLVAYWRPFDGIRHGLYPDQPPQPGQCRETLCGMTLTVGTPTEVEWLAPTCESCWNEARSRRDAQAREEDAS